MDQMEFVEDPMTTKVRRKRAQRSSRLDGEIAGPRRLGGWALTPISRDSFTSPVNMYAPICFGSGFAGIQLVQYLVPRQALVF